MAHGSSMRTYGTRAYLLSEEYLWKELDSEYAGWLQLGDSAHGKNGSSQGDQNCQDEKSDFDGQTVIE
jgi:hypothetical protein